MVEKNEKKCNGVYIAGKHFNNFWELEEYCLENEEFEEQMMEEYYLQQIKEDIDTYLYNSFEDYGEENYEYSIGDPKTKNTYYKVN